MLVETQFHGLGQQLWKQTFPDTFPLNLFFLLSETLSQSTACTQLSIFGWKQPNSASVPDIGHDMELRDVMLQKAAQAQHAGGVNN